MYRDSDITRPSEKQLSKSSVPLCVPHLDGNEWKYVKECLDANWVSSAGPFVDRFERMVAEYTCSRYAVATVNGTSALHIALILAGIQPDDEVVVSDLTFIAPANAIRYAGAWPVFIDAEPDYWQMDTVKLVDFLDRGCSWKNGELRNKVTGRRVRAILPVHILGHPVDMDPVLEVASKYDLSVIEDATESLGAKYKGRMVGTLGDSACFSFNGNKIITTGGGGMLVTDNEEWARKVKYLTTQAKDDTVEFVHAEIGYNYRLTNIQAAIGCAQMEKLEDYIKAKRRIAERYTNALESVPGLTPMRQSPRAFGTFWLFTVLVDEEEYGMGSRSLLKRLGDCRIQTRPLWQPIHKSPAHKKAFHTECPVSEFLNKTSLSLPCTVSLDEEEQGRVIQLLFDLRRAD